jgi:hypothetical protein
LNEGILSYKIFDPIIPLLTTIYSETFEEALEKINSSTRINFVNDQSLMDKQRFPSDKL